MKNPETTMTEARAKDKLCPLLAGFASLARALTADKSEATPKGIQFTCVGSRCMWWEQVTKSAGQCGVVSNKKVQLSMNSGQVGPPTMQ